MTTETTKSMETYRDPKTDHLLTAENAALALIDFQPGQCISRDLNSAHCRRLHFQGNRSMHSSFTQSLIGKIC